MRRLLPLLVLSLAWIGCQDTDESSDFASGSTNGGPPAETAGGAGSTVEGGGGRDESHTGASESGASGGGGVPGAASGSSISGGSASSGVGGSTPGGVGGLAGGAAGGGLAVPGVVGPGGATATSGLGDADGATLGGASSSDAADPPANVQQRGQLTAGAWDDNLNFERFTEFREELYDGQGEGLLPFRAADFDAAHALFEDGPSPHARLDVALVIDTTGSMGDEIGYLQREFISLSSAIETAYPDAEQRWALVLYRDRGDDYVTRQFDFESDLEVFRTKLGQQAAGGGGDFPEAPEAAFEVMNQFSWRSDDEVARLAFWVADAPHHAENAAKLAQGIRSAQEQGVHVYPVASSGIDEFTELSMRSAAQLTGGRYLFLTDDSGIGGSHKEPSIPCYYVTLLRDAILRMVDIEMSGEHREPTAAEVIRTGGDPQDRACKLANGEVVLVY